MGKNSPRRPDSSGWPSKFTPENRRIIINAVKMGIRPAATYRLVRVSESAIRKWLKRGETLAEEDYSQLSNEDREYVDFYFDIQKAEGMIMQHALAKWVGWMDRDSKAPKEFMAKRFPEEWGDKMEITFTQKKEEEFQELLEELEGDYIDAESEEVTEFPELEPGDDDDDA
jgi:hypothetical protein